MAGRFEAARRAHLEAAWLAAHVGLLSQVDPRKIPSIHKIAGEPEPAPRRTSDAELLAGLTALAARSTEGGEPWRES